MFSRPRKFAGKPAAGQVAGARLSLHGVAATNMLPGRNGPVTMSTVSELESAPNSAPEKLVTQALSSTDVFRLSTDRLGLDALPWSSPAAWRRKICWSSPWLSSMKLPPKRGARYGTTSLESGSVSPSATTWPKLDPTLATVALSVSLNTGVTVATSVVGSKVTE